MALRKSEPTPAPATAAVEVEPTTASDKKGAPTPKRKEQEAANKRGLIVDPKASSKDRRAKDRVRRETEFTALRAGDEKNMPLEHRGPEKRYIRDYIDARTSVGEFLLPFSLLFVILSLAFGNANTAIGGILILLFYIIVLMAAVETFLMMRRLKKLVIAKFGANKVPRGFTFYAIARSLNLRRFRTPRPKNKRGEFPV